eukprot:768732-Hanusia_phi.AAC.10
MSEDDRGSNLRPADMYERIIRIQVNKTGNNLVVGDRLEDDVNYENKYETVTNEMYWIYLMQKRQKETFAYFPFKVVS